MSLPERSEQLKEQIKIMRFYDTLNNLHSTIRCCCHDEKADARFDWFQASTLVFLHPGKSFRTVSKIEG